ncbi:MAG TPA: winged helix-turn-helix transcriptional regulator [Stellaceae bacterium]|nr:winged helix-turn-helix transcriptional regulator [Stellaceae bacterium]
MEQAAPLSLGRREESKNGEIGIMLGMLAAVERDSHVTQRHLARELNIALGLANAYLKRCAKKGYIKIRQVPLNRYAYYLTPRGFAEKSRLTAEYLTVSFDFFRRARLDAVTLLSACQARGWNRIVLWGAGELAEVMVLSAAEADVSILAVVDGAAAQAHCGGKPVVADLAAAARLAGDIDALVITDAKSPRASLDAALAAAVHHGIAAERVVAPPMLQLTRAAGTAAP